MLHTNCLGTFEATGLEQHQIASDAAPVATQVLQVCKEQVSNEL